MSGSGGMDGDGRQQSRTDEAATGPAAPGTPDDARRDAEDGAAGSGETTDKVRIMNGRDANEDETSEGWADRGGI